MKENTPYNKLFTKSGCLSQDMMFRYLRNEVNAEERRQVEKHLIDCELCSDAVEVFEQTGTITYHEEVVNKINRKVDIITGASGKKGRIIGMMPALRYAVAASLLVLFGLSFYLINQIMQKDDDVGIAQREEQVEERTSETQSTAPAEEQLDLTEADDVGSTEVPEESTTGSPAASAPEFQEREPALKQMEKKDNTSPPPPVQQKSKARMAETQQEITNQRAAPSAGNKLEDDVVEEEVFNTRERNEISTDAEKQTATAPSAQTESLSIRADETRDGVAKFQQGQYRQALRQLRGVLKDDPNNVEALHYSGLSALQLRQYDNAIEHLQKVALQKQSPFYESAIFHLALAFQGKDNLVHSRKLLREVILMNGNYRQQAEAELQKIGE